MSSDTFGCVGATIKLRSGGYFDYLNPQPEQFMLDDIAGGLSKICRFGGQCPVFYSVAEHSVLCYRQARADRCTIDCQAAALFHDAAEAFCGDVVKPLKNLLTEYAAIEKRVEEAIGRALDIDFARYAGTVREIDQAMLIAERKALFGRDGVKWSGEDSVRTLNVILPCWEPELAEAAFLKAAGEIIHGGAE